MQTLNWIDQSNPKSVQKYEDLMRKRLKKFGYQLSKRKTTNHYIDLKRGYQRRGFRIVELASGAIVKGNDYELTLSDIEQFWLNEYKQWYVKRREDKARERREKIAEITDI